MTLPYSDLLLEHFRHPRNYGVLPAPDVAYEDVNPLCGDRIRMELNIGLDQSITAVRFRGDSCIISQAAASIWTEQIKGRHLQEVVELPQDLLLTALDITVRPSRMKCALLPFQVIRSGIATYLSKS